MRQTLIMVLPILFFESIRIIIVIKSMKHQLRISYFKPTLRALTYTVSNVLGLLTIKILNIPSYSIYGETRFESPDKWIDNFFDCLDEFIKTIGFGNIERYKHGWFITVFSIFSVLCVVSAFLKLFFSKKFDGIGVLIVLFTLGVIGVFGAGIFVKIDIRNIYFFMWYPLVALSQTYIISSIKNIPKLIMTIVLLLLCCTNLLYSYIPNICEIKNEPESNISLASKWLCDNNYEIVYGEHQQVAKIAAETDGQIIAASWYGEMFKALEYINSPNLYSPDKNEKAVYYIQNSELLYALEYAKPFGGLTCLVHFSEGGLYSCPSQLMFFS